FLTCWPSTKFTLCSLPSTWLRRATVLEACTVPSPSRLIGTSLVEASVAVTGIGAAVGLAGACDPCSGGVLSNTKVAPRTRVTIAIAQASFDRRREIPVSEVDTTSWSRHRLRRVGGVWTFWSMTITPASGVNAPIIRQAQR